MADRVEREIEEILRKIDDFPTEAARIRARRRERERRPSVVERFAGLFRGVGIPQVLLLGIVLVLGSHFIIGRFDSTAAQYGIIIGLVLFFSSFLLSLRPRGVGRATTEKRWRGRVIEPEPNERSPWSRLGRRWRRR